MYCNCHAVIFNTKSSGTCSTESCTYGVKQRHTTDQKKQDLDHCHYEINRIQNFGS